MNTHHKWVVAGLLASSLCYGKVTGKKVEKLGVEWNPTEFTQWVVRPNAVITPEVSNLAVQYCLRTTQERLDVPAYDGVAKKLVAAMEKRFLGQSPGKSDTEQALAGVTRLLKAIDAIDVKSGYRMAPAYEKACQEVFAKTLRATENERLLFAYEGRMNPDLIRDLPKNVSAKLEKLAKQGIRVAPLTLDGLKEQICKLEGYYSTSSDARLWKFFSTTRTLANVLPKAANNVEFVKVVYESPEIVELTKVLNEYSSVAGRQNGPSVGNHRADLLDPDRSQVRLTGPALGSKSAAMMAFFTTAWREQLQDHVIQENYPTKPFQLISAAQVLKASERTATELANLKAARSVSQTELGMSAVWSAILPWTMPNVRPAYNYGTTTTAYKNASGLAWLALNAETNVRQNEKIAALERALAVRPKAATTNVFGSEASFTQIVKELEAAELAYKWVDPTSDIVKTSCVRPLKEFNAAAAEATKQKSWKVVQVDPQFTSVFLRDEKAFEFKPVIVDIGGELMDDPEGLDGQHDFKLHLATGRWRGVPVTLDGKAYLAGTPSAFVLHLPSTTSTAEWQAMVHKYDAGKAEAE